MATKRYSIVSRDGATLFTFTTPPPQEVRDVLRTAKDCRWMPFQKQWKCTNDRLRMRLERLLADAGWAMGQSVTPELAPLNVRTSTDANGTVRLAFNRKFSSESEKEMAEKLKAVSCIDASDKLVWLCSPAKEREVRNILSMYSVGDSTTNPQPGSVPVHDSKEKQSVNMSHNNNNTVTLTFPDGIPPPDRIAEMRGALTALGYLVSAKDDLGDGKTSDDTEVSSEEPASKRPKKLSGYSVVRAAEK